VQRSHEMPHIEFVGTPGEFAFLLGEPDFFFGDVSQLGDGRESAVLGSRVDWQLLPFGWLWRGDKHFDFLSRVQCFGDAPVDTRTGPLALMTAAILIEAGFETAKSQPDIDHDIVHDKGVHAGQRWRFGVEPDQALRVLGPFTEKLKTGVGEHPPGRVLPRRRRGVDFDRFTFGFRFAAQTACESGLQKHVADMLVSDAEDLADFGSVVARLRKRSDLVRFSDQALCDFSSWSSRVHVVLYASEIPNKFLTFTAPGRVSSPT
jgi:hypothetical protein